MSRAERYGYANGDVYRGLSTESVFERIAQENTWNNTESISGHGSSVAQTRTLVNELPRLFRKLGIQSLLDLPCGDFNWMREVITACPFLTSVEADISPKVLAAAGQLAPPVNCSFQQLNLLTDALPKVDMLFCRDCLVHLSLTDVERAIQNIKSAGITYLMTTTFPDEPANIDIVTGGWRPLNFAKSPFNWPEAVLLLNENCTECDGAFADKSLGVWRIEELKD